jgi:hypothetical protein
MFRTTACAILLAGALFAPPVHAQAAFSVDAVPGVRFPLGESASLFTTGGGMTLATHFNLLPWLGVGGELAYASSPLNGTQSKALSFFSVGPSSSVTWEPFSRVELNLAVSGGYYLGLLDSLPGDGGYVSARAGASYRFVGGFGAGVGAAYTLFLGKASPLFSGLGVNLFLSYRPEDTRVTPRLRFDAPRMESLFPVLYSWYDSNSVGVVTIHNEEKAAIDSVEVSLFVAGFMDQPKVCMEIPRIAAGESRDVSLFALFSDKVLEITEGTKVAGELKARYRIGKEDRTVSHSVTIGLYDRNASIWDDDRKAAAFVTAKDPVVLRFAKNVATVVNMGGLPVFTPNVRTASGVFEAVRAHGVSYVVDPKSSYEERSKQKNAVDYLQFPRQTLQYRAGDCDDLSILTCAMLESVGIETAFITAPGHIFMAFDTGMAADEAAAWFSQESSVIVRDGRVWMPVEITLVREGFPAAWLKGAAEWAEASAGNQAGFFPLHDAWMVYKPVGLPGAVEEVTLPAESKIADAYSASIRRMAEREAAAFTESLRGSLAKKPLDSKLQNRLGVTYARFCLTEKAAAEFGRILLRGEYAPALINLGLIQVQAGNARKALEYFARAQKKDPTNASLLAGIARAQSSLGNTKAAAEAIDALKKVSPEAAERYAFLARPDQDKGRAASAEEEAVTWVE